MWWRNSLPLRLRPPSEKNLTLAPRQSKPSKYLKCGKSLSATWAGSSLFQVCLPVCNGNSILSSYLSYTISKHSVRQNTTQDLERLCGQSAHLHSTKCWATSLVKSLSSSALENTKTPYDGFACKHLTIYMFVYLLLAYLPRLPCT